MSASSSSSFWDATDSTAARVSLEGDTDRQSAAIWDTAKKTAPLHIHRPPLEECVDGHKAGVFVCHTKDITCRSCSGVIKKGTVHARHPCFKHPRLNKYWFGPQHFCDWACWGWYNEHTRSMLREQATMWVCQIIRCDPFNLDHLPAPAPDPMIMDEFCDDTSKGLSRKQYEQLKRDSATGGYELSCPRPGLLYTDVAPCRGVVIRRKTPGAAPDGPIAQPNQDGPKVVAMDTLGFAVTREHMRYMPKKKFGVHAWRNIDLTSTTAESAAKESEKNALFNGGQAITMQESKPALRLPRPRRDDDTKD